MQRGIIQVLTMASDEKESEDDWIEEVFCRQEGTDFGLDPTNSESEKDSGK